MLNEAWCVFDVWWKYVYFAKNMDDATCVLTEYHAKAKEHSNLHVLFI